MPQKVVIERVQVRGAAPYLGMSATPDGQQIPLYSTNPDIVMRWLCDGWRCRYNQLRSRRTKWDREFQMAVPLNGRPEDDVDDGQYVSLLQLHLDGYILSRTGRKTDEDE